MMQGTVIVNLTLSSIHCKRPPAGGLFLFSIEWDI